MSGKYVVSRAALKRKIVKVAVAVSVALLLADLVYKTVHNISYLTREKCFLYRSLPRWQFLFFEYFIELGVAVFVGVFLATVLGKYFSRYQGLYPKSVLTAFAYGSLIPVCACAVLPLVKTLRGKLKFRVLITLVVAAPLLSPYIIAQSFLVLGATYGALRILASFVLSVISGYVLELFYKAKQEPVDANAFIACDGQLCPAAEADVYLGTYDVFLKVLPYLFIAAAGGLAFELLAPRNLLLRLHIGNNVWGILLVIAVGLPLYLCHGAEVFFLRPLLAHGGLSFGTAMAFSLTSTSICITSMVMLLKFLGRRLTFVLTVNIVVVTLLLSLLINLLF